MNHLTEPHLLAALARLHPPTRRYLMEHHQALAAVSSRVADGDPGWAALTGTRLDQGWADLSQQMDDALEAWRQNPLARRIVSLTTDFVVGDGITLSARHAPLQRFIDEWWYHPENRMDLRLDGLCDDLTRDGELFPVLHVNPAVSDATPYVRFKPASVIDQISWDPNDYERELAYHEMVASAGDSEGRWWLNRCHAQAADAAALMTHYAINRPGGCVRGESDLGPALVWLRRYSHWLEDRARLNWASRMFLWFVTVPTGRVLEKQQQYKAPPESGSIVVHDEGESWELKTPSISASDVKADGRAIKRMAAVATGTPLHYLADEENANLATAQAMKGPADRHYARRQRYFTYMLRDLTAQAYNLWLERGHRRWTPCTYRDITAMAPDVARDDHQKLAEAARSIVGMLGQLREQLLAGGIEPGESLNRKTVEMAFKFAGELLQGDEIEAILGGP